MLNLLSGAVTLAAFIPYIAAILRRETVPSRASWVIWSAVGLLLLSTYRGLGSEAALGVAAGALLGQCAVTVLAFRYGAGGMSAFDRACLCAAAVIALLWWATSSPFLPHLLTLCMDVLAYLPTLRKTLRDPRSENLWAWALWTAGAALALLNVRAWTVANALYPLYITVANSLMTALILRRFRR